MVELIDNVTGIFVLEIETIIIYAYTQKKNYYKKQIGIVLLYKLIQEKFIKI